MKTIKTALTAAFLGVLLTTAHASLQFNGTNSKAGMDGNYLDGALHSNYTFEVWIKPFTYTHGLLFGKSEYWKEWGLYFTGPTRGLVFAGAWPNYYWGTEAATNSITTNVWQHICCAVTNGVATFYVNGLQAGTENVQNPISFNASTNIGMMPPYGCDTVSAIGYADSGTTPDYDFFNGLIYGIKVWNRTLASNEVYVIATTGVPLTTNGLCNAVMLNEGSGTVIHDSLTSLTGRVLTASWSTDNPNLLRVDLIKAVKPSFSHLWVGTNYQLQVSSDLNTWYNQGPSFTATSTNMVYPLYYDVDFWDQLFFRLQLVP